MPPRRKSALEDLIRQGLVADGELLRYKSKQGQVMAIGRAREGGIEVEGKSKLLGYTAFEDVAGSKYHRPAEHTHTTASRNLQGLALLAAGEGGGSAGGRSRKDADEEPAVELLKDENDDLCHVCGLGGDLMCCETCPAVFHAACLGLAAPPASDFFCPMCICSVCGNGRSEGVMPTGCQWVDCQNFAGTEALQQLSRPHIGPPGDTGSQGPGSTAHAGAAPPAADAAAVKVESTEVPEAAGSAGAAGAEPMQVDAAGEAGAPADAAAGASAEGAAGYPAADFSQLVAAASAQWQATHAPADAAQAAVAWQAIAASASENAAVPCPVTLRWAHLRCFPPEFIQQLRQGTSQPCISTAEAAATSTRLAAVCSAGLLPLGSIPEGARAASGGAGGVDARAPLPLSLLVVRGAAAAAPGDCRGYAPVYSPEQRQQVQVALSAALQVLHSCYAPIPDSRTGADVLPWLLRGAVLANGEADYSGMHTALLYAGSALVAVAAFRSFGEFAELPVLAVRPELQRRNGLGRLLLAAVEQLLLQAGSQWLLMPGFTADGQPYLPAHLAPAQAAPGLQQVPQVQQEPSALLQAKWGYSLAAAEQALAASSHPLVRLPGVLFACKPLSPSSVLPPPLLPLRLQWSSVGDPRQLLREGLLASVAAAPGAAELAAAAAAAAARQAAQSKPRPVGRPPKAPPPAAAAPAVKPEAQQHAVPAPTPEQQQLLALMYQQQILAQQAVAQTIVPGQPVSQQQLMQLYQQQQEQQEAFMQQLKQQYPETYFQQLQQLQLQQQAGQAHLLQQQAAAQQLAIPTEAQEQQMQQAEHLGQ